MDNQDILKKKKTEKISFADSIKTAYLGIYLWFQVPVGERRRMHEFNSRKYLFRNISSLSSRYLSEQETLKGTERLADLWLRKLQQRFQFFLALDVTQIHIRYCNLLHSSRLPLLSVPLQTNLPTGAPAQIFFHMPRCCFEPSPDIFRRVGYIMRLLYAVFVDGCVDMPMLEVGGHGSTSG